MVLVLVGVILGFDLERFHQWSNIVYTDL